MTALKNLVKKYPVSTFFLLAYAITWSSWIPISYLFVHGVIEVTPQVYLLYAAGSFGPLLSGAVVTWLIGGSLRAWFGQVLKWRVHIKWWLLAFFLPVGLYALMAGIHIALGGQLDAGRVAPLLSLPGGFLMVFLWGGGNEELGWRGFALPQLQKKQNPLISSLIIGVIWTFWHVPPGIIELGFVEWLKGFPFYLVTITGISIVATWLYNKTGGSVLLTMVFHASVNVFQSLYPVGDMFSLTGEFARMGAWIVMAMVLLTAPGLQFFSVEPGTTLKSGSLESVSPDVATGKL